MKPHRASGSGDVQEANKAFVNMSSVKKLESSSSQDDNCRAARRAFAQLMCARIFILNNLLQKMPLDTEAAVARQRWVLAQILPPRVEGGTDIFVTVLRSIRRGQTDILERIYSDTLTELKETKGDLFPSDTRLFVVIDEAQVAAEGEKGLQDYFRSRETANPRPILREIVDYYFDTLFCGVILAGTGLSVDIVKTAVSSISLKDIGPRPAVFVDAGSFGKNDPSHRSYIERYLSSDNDSDKRFLERVQYWLSGR